MVLDVFFFELVALGYWRVCISLLLVCCYWAARVLLLQTRLWHALGMDWPLTECIVLAEFLEYLKGESHFFAAVVSLENALKEKQAAYLEQVRGTGTLTAEAEASLELMATRAGLLEMGVLKQKLPRATLLQPENVDAEALRAVQPRASAPRRFPSHPSSIPPPTPHRFRRPPLVVSAAC